MHARRMTYPAEEKATARAQNVFQGQADKDVGAQKAIGGIVIHGRFQHSFLAQDTVA